MMKKSILPLVIGTILTGCGSDSDSDSSPVPANQVSAVFMDAGAVQSVSYDCANTGETGVTDVEGSFTVTEGAVCSFELDGYPIGNNVEGITQENNQITAYSLVESVASKMSSKVDNAQSSIDFASKVSALLQSIDADSDVENGIDTTAVVGTSLVDSKPLEATNDAEFLTAMQSVEVVDETTGEPVPVPVEKIVTPDDAKEKLNGKYESENVHLAIAEVKSLITGEYTTIDVESSLAEIRSNLETEDGSNGYHQKALDAILEILEVVNMDEVADRVEITTEAQYSEMLAQVIDVTLNPKGIVELVETPKGHTEGEAKILSEAAARLINASKRLAAAMPGEGYELPYADEGADPLTYQDSLVIRAAALGAANALYVASAYKAGDDADYLPQQMESTEVDIVNEVRDYSTNEVTYEDVTYTFEDVEFDTLSTDPIDVAKSSDLFTYHVDADMKLSAAKEALTLTVEVANLINLEEYLSEEEVDDAAELLKLLTAHLEDSESTLTLTDDDSGESISANLHAFYATATGIDRSDIIITGMANGYTCDLGEYTAENAHYDKTLSRIFGEPTCTHDAGYLSQDKWGNVWVNWELVEELGYHYDEENHTYTFSFIPAVEAEYELVVEESSSSNLLDVVWCGIDDNEDKISCLETDGE